MGGGGVGMTRSAREKALLCVTAAVSWSGDRFVEDCGRKEIINIMVGVVFTLSECAGILPSSNMPSTPNAGEDEGGPAGIHLAAGGWSEGGGSGLTAGVEALRIACLECLQ
ncbi:unnamed protein product, partial [Choristocarpus tenellus]